MEYPTGQQSTGGGRQNGLSCSSKAGMTQPVLRATSQHLRCHGDRGRTGGEGIKLLPQIHKSLWAKLFLASPFYNPCLRALCHQKLDICPNCRAENLVPILSVGTATEPMASFLLSNLQAPVDSKERNTMESIETEWKRVRSILLSFQKPLQNQHLHSTPHPSEPVSSTPKQQVQLKDQLWGQGFVFGSAPYKGNLVHATESVFQSLNSLFIKWYYL